MLMNRRAVMKALAATSAMPLLPNFAHAASQVRMQLAWIPNVEYAGLWIALERGYMKDAGVDFSYMPGGPNALQGPVAVAAGSADIGITGWLPLIDAIKKGNDFVAIAVPFQISPLGILSLAKHPILKPQDLEGATILGKGATVKQTLDATYKLNGLKGEPKIVEVGYTVEPLVAGQGDGQVGFGTDQPLQLKHMGMTPDKDYFFTSFDDLGFKAYSALMFTTRSFLDANRDALVGMVKAMIRGWQENEKDLTVAAKLASEKYGADYSLNFEHQVDENKAQLGFMKPRDNPDYPLLTLNRDYVKGPMVAAAAATGRTDLPDIDSIFDFSIAEEAHKQLKA